MTARARDELELSAALLREAFDRSFAAPPASPELAGAEALRAVRAGSLRLALPVDALAGIRRRPHIAPLPSRTPELLGLGAFRGELVGMYALGRLCGADAVEDGEGRGWAALVRGAAVGLVFDELEQHVRAAADDFQPLAGAASDAIFRRVVALGAERRHVVDVAALLARLAAAATPATETR
ncbi:MAG: chemotaxis protein CheW [Myxococcota bacterium]